MAAQEGQTYVPFCLTFKHIIRHPNDTTRPRYYRRTSLSCPPMIATAFQTSSWSDAFSWTPGFMRHLSHDEAQDLTTHSTSSIFWCSDHQTYLTVPYDCTETSVRDRAEVEVLDNWERLRFGHEARRLNNERRAVSVIGHQYAEPGLAAVGPPSWVPQLIPEPHQRSGSPAPLDTTGTSLLAGDLSILMGLAALSTTLDNVPYTIQESFRPPLHNLGWKTHDQPSFGSTCSANYSITRAD